jgi:hypothetical protein
LSGWIATSSIFIALLNNTDTISYELGYGTGQAGLNYMLRQGFLSSPCGAHPISYLTGTGESFHGGKAARKVYKYYILVSYCV